MNIPHDAPLLVSIDRAAELIDMSRSEVYHGIDPPPRGQPAEGGHQASRTRGACRSGCCVTSKNAKPRSGAPGPRSSMGDDEAQRATSNRPDFQASRKYLIGRVYTDGRTVPFAIWNGVRDYSSEPPVPPLAVEFQMRGAAGGRLGVVQVRSGKSAKSLIAGCVPAFDCIVVWTRDRKAYRAAVDQLSGEGATWMQ